MDVYPDQWGVLKTIKKVSTAKLDEVYTLLVEKSLFATTNTTSEISNDQHSSNIQEGHALEIILDNQIYLPKFQIPASLLGFIKDELNFLNAEYITKKRLGKSAYNTPKYFNCIQENDQYIILPRGFLRKMEDFCEEHSLAYTIADKRVLSSKIKFTSTIQLYEYQKI